MMDLGGIAIAILIIALIFDMRSRHKEIVKMIKAIGIMMNELTDMAAREASSGSEERGSNVRRD